MIRLCIYDPTIYVVFLIAISLHVATLSLDALKFIKLIRFFGKYFSKVASHENSDSKIPHRTQTLCNTPKLVFSLTIPLLNQCRLKINVELNNSLFE